ncbi:hypothetical protein RJ639_034365 [Escallonia herrerae]|uniref:Uncharacterized protein n=1 Tax=Escallonia herrerae TaxID=1293975 RepID=A0AA89B8G9_9ASTE|nr:hypothetical protein RJ639_034365 [Escallonia herrerae]
MLRAWKWYQNCLAVHPVKTQVISSGLIWGFGDIAAQAVTHSTAKKRCQITVELPGEKGVSATFIMVDLFPDDDESDLDLRQVIFNYGKERKMCLPREKLMQNFPAFDRYEGLDRFIRLRLQLQPKSLRFVATKVAVDGIIFGPLDLLVFFTYMGFASGKSADQVKEDVRRDFLPALILEGGIWPIVQVANFRFVPVRYQLLYVNFFCLLDSCFLSWIEQQQDAPWKQWFKSLVSLKEKEGQGR